MRTEFMVMSLTSGYLQEEGPSYLVAGEITKLRERWDKGKQSYLASTDIWAPYCSARSK